MTRSFRHTSQAGVHVTIDDGVKAAALRLVEAFKEELIRRGHDPASEPTDQASWQARIQLTTGISNALIGTDPHSDLHNALIAANPHLNASWAASSEPIVVPIDYGSVQHLLREMAEQAGLGDLAPVFADQRTERRGRGS